MNYEQIRQQFRPASIKYLLVAESPPPVQNGPSSRRFYQADYQKADDRLFANTIRAVFLEAAELDSKELESGKPEWLERLRDAGFYMIEALEESQEHEVTKKARQALLYAQRNRVIERVKELVQPGTKIILIKSNVFEMLAEPLRQSGFEVLNSELLDYPGRFNQRDYREKLAAMLANS
jgi:alkylation response protein AidB-like acyl-CoA dehydrogenase